MSVFCHCNAMFSMYVGLIPCICQRNVRDCVRTMFVCAQTKSRFDCLYSYVCPACLSAMPLCLSALCRGVCLLNTRVSSFQRPCVCLLYTRVSSCSMSVRLFSLCPCVCLLNTRVSVFSLPVCTVCLLNACVSVCSMPVHLSVQCYCICQLMPLCLPA